MVKFQISGTPSISDMSLIALRNHGLLSHWVSDTVLQCISIVGADADDDDDIDDTEHHCTEFVDSSDKKIYSGLSNDINVCEAVTASQTSQSSDYAVGIFSKIKRKHDEIDLKGDQSDLQGIQIVRKMEDRAERNKICQHRREMSVSVLMQLYDLCEVLDVEDDLMSQEQSTQIIFKRRYLHPLCALPCLASSIRTRNSELDNQASRNRSNQWDGDDIHFSYTRDSNREGPFDPRRDRRMGPSGCISEEHLKCYSKSTPNEFTTHVLKVNAISSSEIFHADFDPKAIRRRQFIDHYN